MGLFGNSYSKPGPGVNKDAPKKKGVFLYFEIFARKFFKLLQANMLHFIVSIPMFAVLFLLAPINLEPITNLANTLAETDSTVNADELVRSLFFVFKLIFTNSVFVLIGSGPASAALAYIMRCFTREQHAWLLSDGRDKFKENFKQSITLSVLDIFLIFLGTIAFTFYHSLYTSTQSPIWLIIMGLLCTLTIVYLFMHFYIYQLMVTFRCTFFELLKNSMLFAVMYLPMNIFFTLLVVGITAVMYSFIPYSLTIFISFLILTALLRFPIEFFAAKTIEKRVLNIRKKPVAAQKKETEDE